MRRSCTLERGLEGLGETITGMGKSAKLAVFSALSAWEEQEDSRLWDVEYHGSLLQAPWRTRYLYQPEYVILTDTTKQGVVGICIDGCN